jgi:hypothetical protein
MRTTEQQPETPARADQKRTVTITLMEPINPNNTMEVFQMQELIEAMEHVGSDRLFRTLLQASFHTDWHAIEKDERNDLFMFMEEMIYSGVA